MTSDMFFCARSAEKRLRDEKRKYVESLTRLFKEGMQFMCNHGVRGGESSGLSYKVVVCGVFWDGRIVVKNLSTGKSKRVHHTNLSYCQD